jgi:hypothetical protein
MGQYTECALELGADEAMKARYKKEISSGGTAV